MTKVLIALFFVIATKLVWAFWPGLFTCFLSWAVGLLWLALWTRYYGFNVAMGMAMVGTLSNTAVTLANGGHMPVLGQTTTVSAWIPLTPGTQLNFLGDVFGLASIGDLLVIGAGLVALVRYRGRALEPGIPVATSVVRPGAAH